MRILVIAALSIGLVGCSRTEPIRAGGKPVEYWVEAIRGPDACLRKKAAFKLGNVGPADAQVLPALVGALKDADPAVRREAVIAIVKFGPEAKEARPVLESLLTDKDPKVRSAAGKALSPPEKKNL